MPNTYSEDLTPGRKPSTVFLLNNTTVHIHKVPSHHTCHLPVCPLLLFWILDKLYWWVISLLIWWHGVKCSPVIILLLKWTSQNQTASCNSVLFHCKIKLWHGQIDSVAARFQPSLSGLSIKTIFCFYVPLCAYQQGCTYVVFVSIANGPRDSDYPWPNQFRHFGD